MKTEQPMNSEPLMWAIAVTFCDVEMNGFVTLGGAGLYDQDEWNRQWAAIPVSELGAEDPSLLVADKIDADGERVDERFITAETAEALFKRPLAELIAEGRANTAFTVGQLLERQPELAAQFASARQAI